MKKNIQVEEKTQEREALDMFNVLSSFQISI